jgi:hypothetical protein
MNYDLILLLINQIYFYLLIFNLVPAIKINLSSGKTGRKDSKTSGPEGI